MNKNWNYIKTNIERHPEYCSSVFEQGFLLTDKEAAIRGQFPFYDFWHMVDLAGKAYLYVHQDQKAFVVTSGEDVFFLLGHAYDPFASEWDEQIILKRIAEVASGDFRKAIPAINDLTGLFLFGMFSGGELTLCGDFESMRTAYYGKADGHWYVTSHEEIAALIAPLTRVEEVEKLEHYRWYHLYGEGLPGDISHYHELKKLISNTYVVFSQNQFSVKRFYPSHEIQMCSTDAEYEETVDRICTTMSNNMDMIAKKWETPAISATGGRDSKGTMAAAYHIKDIFLYYSYNSQPGELVDCEAARKICDAIGVEHTIYDIPLDQSEYEEYELVKAILCVNSNRLYFNHNDIMKRIYFFRKKPLFDIEVKSWTSEIGRAYYYARYGVRRMQGKCTGRRLNAMNNIYLFNPKLMYWADRVYDDYIRRTDMQDGLFNYDWTDMAKSELRHSRWGADVISCEHMFSNDVTIPYNNRHLADLMLSVPLEKRIKSQTHIDFTAKLCPPIEELNINIKDVNHDNKRMWMDKIYYFVTTVRPF